MLTSLEQALPQLLGDCRTLAAAKASAVEPVALAQALGRVLAGDVCAAVDVPQHDGSVLRLRKTHLEYDPLDRVVAMDYIARHQAKGELVTGLLYVSPEAEDLHAHLNTVDTAFNKLGLKELCPGREMLEKLNATMR